MFPTRLNLLLPKKRKHLTFMVNVQFVKSILEVLLIIICLIAMVLLGSRTILQNHFSDLTENSNSISSQHVETNHAIVLINKNLQEADELQKKYVLWTPFLYNFFELIPNNISLSTLDINKKDGLLTITGIAESREALLNLQDSLEAAEFIDAVEIPLSQLLQKEEISFSLTTDLK